MENIEIQKPESEESKFQEEDEKKPEISPEGLKMAREKFQEIQDLIKQAKAEGSEEKLEEAGRLKEEIEGIMEGEKKENINKEKVQKAVDLIQKYYAEVEAQEDFYLGIELPKVEEKIISQISEINPLEMQEIINQLLEKNKDVKRFGLPISLLTEKTVEEYIKKEKGRGKKEDEIKALNFNFNFKSFRSRPNDIGFRNPEKCQLTIEGDVGLHFGDTAKGGKIKLNGDANKFVGEAMKGGIIEIKGNVVGSIGQWMKNGKIVIDGRIETADDFVAYSSDNKGEIWYNGERIWPK